MFMKNLKLNAKMLLSNLTSFTTKTWIEMKINMLQSIKNNLKKTSLRCLLRNSFNEMDYQGFDQNYY